ncbi:unnamed protein product [Gongylonema pulchrum]|uniref:Uncharacterized protein n=1 Tax=Gongylonema pulchrum TaxID=637853 RepID=A0A3P7R5V4_9BILA|nr:unnamed protein product [Gongylonema pulchrum]
MHRILVCGKVALCREACDTLAEKGFKLLATCCSGANGLVATQGAGPLQQVIIECF